MLLKYVSSYVSKCHNAVRSELLYSPDLGAFQAASSFLQTMKPLEPEMVMQLMSTKIAWTESHTKSISVPRPDNEPAAAYTKYLKRSKEGAQPNFLEWLRAYDHEKTTPKRYKTGNTFVAIKYLSSKTQRHPRGDCL